MMFERFRVQLTRLGNALDAEFFKIARRRMTWILLLSLIALVFAFYLLLWLRIYNGPGHRRGSYFGWLEAKSAMSFLHVLPYSLALERFFATLVCVIFAGSMMGNEYDWRTVGVVAARGVHRWQFLFAKLCTGTLFTAAVVASGFAIGLVASAWWSHVYHLSYGTVDFHWFGQAAAGLARSVFVVLPYVYLAVLCATVFRSAGQAVGAALGAYFVESIFTGILTNAEGWTSHIPDALINYNGESLMRANGTVTGSGGAGPFIFGAGDAPALRAAAVLLAWMAVILAVVFWRFSRRDIQE
jgi:ABC-type transport system involved in multi-copper enzyme maturation permease subunit